MPCPYCMDIWIWVCFINVESAVISIPTASELILPEITTWLGLCPYN